jgi:hypothetical protein
MQKSFAELIQEKIDAYAKSVKEAEARERAELEKFFNEPKKEEKTEKEEQNEKKRVKR